MVTIFDTETNDKWRRDLSDDDPRQPRILSIAACTYDDAFTTELSSFYVLIKPDDFTIDNNSEACQVNHITHEVATAYGIRIESALNMFDQFCYNSSRIIAFNLDFDRRMVFREKVLRNKPHYMAPEKCRCTMLAMAGIMKIPSAFGYDDYKWPSLNDAFAFCFGAPPSGAHNALIDVRHTSWITSHILRQGWWTLDSVTT